MGGRAYRWGFTALALMVVAIVSTSCSAIVAGRPQPPVPKMVTELYVHEEQTASDAAYRVYAALPADELVKVNRGGQFTIQPSGLQVGVRSTFASWFNSARWGCEPPGERMDVAGVAQSRLVLKGKGGVIDLSMRSPRKGVWKSLTIACSKDRAEWVRDGLPMLPAWFMEERTMGPPSGWQGGTHPPAPVREPTRGITFHTWACLRGRYCVYASLSADSLRRLHQSHVLNMRFADLPRYAQHALADSSYESRCLGMYQMDWVHPKWLRDRLYGITQVRFIYARQANLGPQGDGHPEGKPTFPRPYRVVSMTYDGLWLPPERWEKYSWKQLTPPPSEYVMRHLPPGNDPGGLIAWPPGMQRLALDWSHAYRKWNDTWMQKVQGGYMSRPGAPRSPKPPWTYD